MKPSTRQHLLTVLPPYLGLLVAYVVMRLLWLYDKLPHTMHWD